jgi:hypothetical protein
MKKNFNIERKHDNELRMAMATQSP